MYRIVNVLLGGNAAEWSMPTATNPLSLLAFGSAYASAAE